MRNLPKFDDPNLLVGAEGFSDAGVYLLRDDLCIVQSLDFFPPLVDDPYLYGQIAAANSISDVVTMGAQPVTALNINAFPDDKLELELLGEILRGGAERVLAAGAVIVGGHTVRDVEIKYGLSVTGTVHPDQLFNNDRAMPGDVLMLTKPLGTGFVTTAFKAGKCEAAVLKAATDSMIQLNSIGRDAARRHGGHATTDITGFGLGGHAREMADGSGVTIELEISRLPILPGAAALAAAGYMTRASKSNRQYLEQFMRIESTADRGLLEFVFDAQTSGGMLISLPEDQAEAARMYLQNEGAAAAEIVGRVRERGDVAIVLR